MTKQRNRRVLVLLAALVAAALIAASEPLHDAVRALFNVATPFIQRHVIAGAILFVLLSALSAMVVFFSTAIITPVALEAFGGWTTFLLLWAGWVLGGVAAYAIGRFLGRGVVTWFIDPARFHEYELRAQRLGTFWHVLLFQIAVPSEIPGYVLGLARCRFRTFVLAIAIGELPFAIGAVTLGESFLEGNSLLLLSIGIGGLALSWLAFRHASTKWTSSGGQPREGRVMGLVMDHDERGDGREEQRDVLTDAETERGV